MDTRRASSAESKPDRFIDTLRRRTMNIRQAILMGLAVPFGMVLAALVVALIALATGEVR